MTILLEKQQNFTVMLCQLLQWLHQSGYACTVGEAMRTKEQAAAYAAAGQGLKNSLHCDRLAIDLNIFRGTRWITSSSELEPVGLYWESLGGSWGGRFDDGNHFSVSHEGRR